MRSPRLPFPFSPVLVTCSPLSVAVDLPVVAFSDKGVHAACGLLGLASCTQHNIFAGSPLQHLSVPPSFFGLSGGLCCVRTEFVSHSSVEGFWSFHLLVIMNAAAANIHGQISVWLYVFISLGYASRSRSAGLCGNLVFHFLRTCQACTQWPLLPAFPPAVSGALLLRFLTNTCSFLFSLSVAVLLSEYEVFHCGFALHFFNDQWCRISFHVLVDHLFTFFVEVSSQVCCLAFLTGLFLSLLGSKSPIYMCIYIFWILNPS